MAGHFRLSRDILDWGWYRDPNTRGVFLHLLLTANWEDKVFRGHTIKRGQVVVCLSSLADILGISIRNVRTAFHHLKSTNEVTIKTTNKFSIVTICNYERWQTSEQTSDTQDDNQLTNERQTTDKQLTTYKEIYKEINKEIKEEYDKLLSSAKSEFLRVESEMKEQISRLKEEIEDAKKERKKRAKPVPRTLGGFAQAAFEEFYLDLKGLNYEWTAKDGTHMTLLLRKIRRSRENREEPLPCDDENMIEALKEFFKYISDPWLLDHLDVANINSKYNEIVANARMKKCTVQFPENPRHGDRVGLDWFYDLNEGRWIKDGEKNRRGEIFNVQAGRWVI